MQTLEKKNNPIQSFFKKYPFLKYFDFSAVANGCDVSFSAIFLNTINPDLNETEPETIEALMDFIDSDPFATARFFHKDLNDIYSSIIPNQKKFKKLFAEQVTNLDNSFIYEFILANDLIKAGFNADHVYNYLVKIIYQYKTSSTKGNDFAFSHMDRKNCDLFINKDFLHIIKHTLHETKAIKLAFNYFSDFYNYTDCFNLILTVNREIPHFDWTDFFKNNYDEAFDRLHNNLSLELEYKQIETGVANYSLKQREDFIKMQDMTIEVNGETLKIDVPRFRLDLVEYSKKFSNCIGRVESYAQNCVDQKNSVIGLFSPTGKPRYCIYTEKYSFKEAKGVDNEVIPKEVFLELQKLLTLKPSLPTDFIGMEDHFIQGYKYNPEKRSLFLLFILNPDVIYEYLDVSNDIYEEFNKAESKGAYLNKVLKKHEYEKIVFE